MRLRASFAASATTVLICALTAPPVESKRPDARSLLERYRPVLRYDADEEYFAQPVSLRPGSADVRDGDRV